jgi:hypothetical protein
MSAEMPRRDYMHETTERGAERGRGAGFPAFRERPRRDIENAGTGDGGDNQRGREEQRKIGRGQWH